MTYSKTIKIEQGKFTAKELAVKKAVATAYASSPHLSRSQKNRLIDKIF